MEGENKFLGEEKISKLLLKFSIPCILSLLISSLYNIVDQIFIGNSEIGYLGNAATTVVFPITIISVAFAWCFGDGAAAFLSLCQGRKDTKNAHKAVGNSITITFIISIIFVILGFLFMQNVLFLFGASDQTIGLATDYFKIILAAIPIYMLGNMLSAVIRADGSPAFSMAATLAGAITNIVLDPIFIFGLKWGIQGAAYATIIGQILTFIVCIVYLFRTKTFKLFLDSFKINMKLFSNVIKLGVSTFITQMSIVIISLVCNIMLAKYGATSKYGADIPIAVIGICMKVFTIVINIIVGVILGAQPILGYNYGAKKFERVKETFKIVLFITILVGIISTLIFEICPQVVIRMFGTADELYMEFAIKTFRIFLMFVTFTCTIKMTSIFFQAVGNPVKAALVSLTRDIIFFVPLVLILPRFMGVEGALWAAPIADFMGIILTASLIVVFFRNIKNQSSETEEEVIWKSKEGIIITINRQHGSQGKYIGELLSKKLGIPYYYKELMTAPIEYAIEEQDKVIRKIAENGSCVIVGRAADYVLRENKNVVRILIYAPKDYRISKIMEMYNDSKHDAEKWLEKSDKARGNYYRMISGQDWNDPANYDLCIDSSKGNEKTAEIIYEYIKHI